MRGRGKIEIFDEIFEKIAILDEIFEIFDEIFYVREAVRGMGKIEKTFGGRSLPLAEETSNLSVNSGDPLNIYRNMMELYNTIQYYTMLYNYM